MSRKSGALTYPEPLGPPLSVVGELYLLHIKTILNTAASIVFIFISSCMNGVVIVVMVFW